jgi:hypothetical protein
VHAGKVDAGFEDIGVARQACDVSRPPYDSPQIPTRFGSTSGRDLQVLAAGDDVLILAVAGGAGIRRRAERLRP